MKIIWSLWTKPLLYGSGIGWASFKHYLYSWVLSLEVSKPWFTNTELVTDKLGVELIIEELGLYFDNVSLALDEINDEDPSWWTLGKLHTYALQDVPFVHIDHDVFLWMPLPEELLGASVIAQNPEPVVRGTADWYQPEYLETVIRQTENGWLPTEWTWYTSQPNPVQTAYCCGIFGGNTVSFIKHYARAAFMIATHPVNRKAYTSLADKKQHVALLEQYFLSACVSYYTAYPRHNFGEINVKCLFASVEEAKVQAHQVGYTHLIGYAKHDSDIMSRLEQRVQRDYPFLYEKCIEIATKNKYKSV